MRREHLDAPGRARRRGDARSRSRTSTRSVRSSAPCGTRRSGSGRPSSAGEPLGAGDAPLRRGARAATHTLRSKEEAFDYRYFPEPDLTPLAPEPAWVEELRAALPELPAARRPRYVASFGLKPGAGAHPHRLGGDGERSSRRRSRSERTPRQRRTGSRRTSPGCSTRPSSSSTDTKITPRHVADLVAAGAGSRRSRSRARSRCSRRRSRRATTPRRSWNDAGLTQVTRHLGARGVGGRGDRREPRARRAVPQRQGGRAERGPRPGDEEVARLGRTRRPSASSSLQRLRGV